MASGNYARKRSPRQPVDTALPIPARATRQLPAEQQHPFDDEDILTESLPLRTRPTPTTTAVTRRTTAEARRQMSEFRQAATPVPRSARPLQPKRNTTYRPASKRRYQVIDDYAPHPLHRHRRWLNPLVYSSLIGVVFIALLLWAAIAQRPGAPMLLPYAGGQVYSIQVGADKANTWESPKPAPPKVAVPTGPYSILGKPTITADFINKVLANAGSPAAGKGQAMYDLGVQYGIDPVFGLAFFQHESTFGKNGEARTTMSLGNLRCIPDHECIDQDRGGYAKFNGWEDGFRSWYALMRNLYVAQWGRSTIDAIIPKYAPSADNNDEAAYISSVKRAVDNWRAGNI